MVKIGLTGGIGSGKSHIAKFFNVLEIPIFNSDDAARKIINESELVKRVFLDRYGSSIYQNGKINKAKLARIIFNDKNEQDFVNSVIHPKVKNEFHKWCHLHPKSPYIIQEAAILIESGQYKNLDKIILVIASKETRMKRIKLRDNRSEKEILNIINNQSSDEFKLQYADFTIANDDTDNLIPQILNINTKIINGF